MKNIFSDALLLFSFESLDKKIKYESLDDDLYKFKTFSILRAQISPANVPKHLLANKIEIVQKKDHLLLKSLYFTSFKSKLCHNFKNRAITNYFKFFFFLSRKNLELINSSDHLLTDDIYLQTLAINNLYNIYHIELNN
jgi:hypothetical protein